MRGKVVKSDGNKIWAEFDGVDVYVIPDSVFILPEKKVRDKILSMDICEYDGPLGLELFEFSDLLDHIQDVYRDNCKEEPEDEIVVVTLGINYSRELPTGKLPIFSGSISNISEIMWIVNERAGYIPLSFLQDIDEGDDFKIAFTQFVNNGIKFSDRQINVILNMSANQMSSKYNKYGTFKDALKHALTKPVYLNFNI